MSSEVETLEALLATVQRNRRLPRPARGAFTARPTESPASPVSSAPASARAALRPADRIFSGSTLAAGSLILLTLAAVVIAALIAIPLGIAITKRPRLGR